MTTLGQRLRECVQHEYSSAEVRLPPPDPLDPDDVSYKPDDSGGYWVEVEVYVSPMDLYPNPNPVYAVWSCEDFSVERDWSNVSEWHLDEAYQCESDDASGTAARRQAHDRAKYLRCGDNKGASGILYAVRPGSQPPRLFPSAPATAGESSVL